jgi:hypothetical protein
MNLHHEIDKLAREIYGELERLRVRLKHAPLAAATVDRKTTAAIAALQKAMAAIESDADLVGPLRALEREHVELAKLARTIAPTRAG